jgi:nucleoside-diphosphate-sugar epimerase
MYDELLETLAECKGLHVQFHDIYTPGRNDLMSNWIQKIIDGKQPEKSDTIFHWVHVRDALNAVRILSENSVKGKMDLCGRRAWTQEMVLDEIRHLWLRFQNTMEHSHSLESLSEIPSPAAVTYSGERRRPDLEPLHTALLSCGLDGWRPMTAIRVGIMECMAYLLE